MNIIRLQNVYIYIYNSFVYRFKDCDCIVYDILHIKVVEFMQ